MPTPSFSVIDKFDMFSMLWTPMVQLSGLLHEQCTQSTQHFTTVFAILPEIRSVVR